MGGAVPAVAHPRPRLEIWTRRIQECSVGGVPGLFAAPPENLMFAAFPQLFAAFPENLTIDQEMLVKVIKVCPVLKIGSLVGALPEELVRQQDVQIVVDETSFVTAPSFKKHRLLIHTLRRLVLGFATILMLPEVLAWVPAFSALCNKHWDGEGGKRSFYPVQGCKPVPPQTLDLQLPLNMAKIYSS